jgi:uncharacterized protein YaiI (UPF0178 family)
MHVIVSRHAAAVEFIRDTLPEFAYAKIIEQATPEDVRSTVVAGNLPLHLAALAARVVAVEFEGSPPRGSEYTRTDMEAAGARLVSYRVRTDSDKDLARNHAIDAVEIFIRSGDWPLARTMLRRAEKMANERGAFEQRDRIATILDALEMLAAERRWSVGV